MPLQSVSQGFRDISMTFAKHPLTNDLIALKNANTIQRSLKNIIFTFPGEKPFDPEFGSQVSRMLFEIITPLTANRIKREIEYSINRYEPRVLLNDVTVVPNYDNNEFNVLIAYDIVGINVPSQQLDFVLQSTSQ
jgi:phage baseplate assembly protein W